MTKEQKAELGTDYLYELDSIIDDIDTALSDLRWYSRKYMATPDGLPAPVFDATWDLFKSLMEARNDAVRTKHSVRESCLKGVKKNEA